MGSISARFRRRCRARWSAAEGRQILQPNRGIDWDAFARNVNRRRGGGRSHTRRPRPSPQQVAKNLFLWPGRSVVRKALELPARACGSIWCCRSKRILEIYLNIAELGPIASLAPEAGANPCLRPSGLKRLRHAKRPCWRRSCPNPVRAQCPQSPAPGVRRSGGNLHGPGAVLGLCSDGWRENTRLF